MSNNKIRYDAIRRILSSKNKAVHFVGVGGVSMYGLARLVLDIGCPITGSDRAVNDRCRDLERRGVLIYHDHKGTNINGSSLVVHTSAVRAENPELKSALESGIPTVTRAELMGAIMLEYKSRIGVSGTHGKSTTVAILDTIFTVAMARPTTLSGADLRIGSPVRIGDKGVMIYEACEYCDSFLKFAPTIAIALNLELDHTDYFDSISALRRSFAKALSHASSYALVNMDDENLADIIPNIKSRVITFGQSERADWRYLITGFFDDHTDFTLYRFGTQLRKFRLNIPGIHNVLNAAAAAVVALEYGLPADTVARAIEDFKGISRRLELVGMRHGRPVYYDYAHHPTEIIAAINTLKLKHKDEITVIFKPHTYTRTASLWSDFVRALELADHVILTDVFAAREEPVDEINSARLARDVGNKAIYVADCDVVSCVDVCSRGTIVVMGAGDMEMIKNELLK